MDSGREPIIYRINYGIIFASQGPSPMVHRSGAGKKSFKVMNYQYLLYQVFVY